MPTSTGSLKKHESSRKTSTSALLTMPKHNKLWKILKEMGITDKLTGLLRNLHAGQEATMRPGRGTTDWENGDCLLSPCLFYLNAEYIMRNTRLDETQAGIKIARRNINIYQEISITSDMQMTPPFSRKQRTKEPLDESERGE